jgi:hypothetical protein
MPVASIGQSLEADSLEARIASTIKALDEWIAGLDSSFQLVGFGAGGRGVMTLASLQNHMRFSALFDTNYASGIYLTPKTRIPVVGPDQWSTYKDSHCIVFSFGYFDEISTQLIEMGFERERIHSLLKFYELTK